MGALLQFFVFMSELHMAKYFYKICLKMLPDAKIFLFSVNFPFFKTMFSANRDYFAGLPNDNFFCRIQFPSNFACLRVSIVRQFDRVKIFARPKIKDFYC